MLPYLEILIPCGRFSFHDAKQQNMRLHEKIKKRCKVIKIKHLLEYNFPAF